MKTLVYLVEDPLGFHARPASKLFMEAKKFRCSIVAGLGESTADVKDILALMGLGAAKGSKISFTFEGEDEDLAEERFKAILTELL